MFLYFKQLSKPPSLKGILAILLFFILYSASNAQSDSLQLEKMEKLRAESGVDPTRVRSRVGYSFLFFDQQNDRADIRNRLALNLGIGKWSLSLKSDLIVSKFSGEPGSGVTTGYGDTRFSLLNAFYNKGSHSLAGAVEFSLPTGRNEIGNQYFSATPSLTYAFSFNPTLFLAIQPQYSFSIAKDPAYPNLSVLTVRVFMAKFTSSGWFFVIEPRPVFNFVSATTDLIISPIIGKALGSGFNLIMLSEIPTKKNTIQNSGILYQVGFNKNF
jgi:hypothetical protein